MIPRCAVGKGITGAVRYIFSEGRDRETGQPRRRPAGTGSRVGWIGGTGFGFDISSAADADLARRMMEFDALNQASRTRPCVKDCVHLSLGWRPGETPTTEQMEAAAREALAAMGMENARALFAVHTDEGYAHIHIVASKINPATGRAYDLKENYLKLSRWAEQYERDHGGILCAGREEANALRDAIHARDAAAVLALITKQRATFTRHDLDRILGKEIKNTAARTEFAKLILNRPDIVELADDADGPPCRYTTRSVLEGESYVLRAAQGLDRNHHHALPEHAREAVLGRDRFNGITGEQAAALRHATGKEGLAIIDGRAGTGKSYTLAAIREAYETNGCRVIGLAPTNAVAQDMQRDGFRRASTIHSELFALNNGRLRWDRCTVVVVDEAAMVDTKLMAMVTAHAFHAGAKLILVGDDRQLSSIDRGGMFAALKERYGAASLTEVRRQSKNDDRRATELMAEGNFHDALERYDAKGAIHWTASQEEARAALVRRWAADTADDPARSRFVFAYTNLDVDDLNRDLRRVRELRGELGVPHNFETAHGFHAFAAGDRIQFTGTEKALGIYNGNAGVIERIEGGDITVRLDGVDGRRLTFNGAAFANFRHGYAGTIYKGQGRTIDQTYLYHSEHWRSAASYVALSRHRERAELFVGRETARDLRQLARQMGRVEERRAACAFFPNGSPVGPVRPLTPIELLARLAEYAPEWRTVPRTPGIVAASQVTRRRSRHSEPAPRVATPEDRQTNRPSDRTPALDAKTDANGGHSGARAMLRTLWRKVASWLTLRAFAPSRPTPQAKGVESRLRR